MRQQHTQDVLRLLLLHRRLSGGDGGGERGGRNGGQGEPSTPRSQEIVRGLRLASHLLKCLVGGGGGGGGGGEGCGSGGGEGGGEGGGDLAGAIVEHRRLEGGSAREIEVFFHYTTILFLFSF